MSEITEVGYVDKQEELENKISLLQTTDENVT